MRTRKHYRLMRTALSEANMKAQGANRVEILVVLGEEARGSIGNTARKNARSKFYRIMNRLMIKRVADALGKIRRRSEVIFNITVIGQEDSPYWKSVESTDFEKAMDLEIADLREMKTLRKSTTHTLTKRTRSG